MKIIKKIKLVELKNLELYDKIYHNLYKLKIINHHLHPDNHLHPDKNNNPLEVKDTLKNRLTRKMNW